jgi:two-component system cell cycle sensor histidine kinase/response regulator CckA
MRPELGNVGNAANVRTTIVEAGVKSARLEKAVNAGTRIHRSRRWALPLLPPEEVSLRLLRLIQASTSTRDLVHAALVFCKEHSGCESVGIRLREGDSFPHAEIRGFPSRFIRLESGLCGPECVCANVIQGRFDAGSPFFTAGGSFWTNSTTELLTGGEAMGRRLCALNRCTSQGYESVLLVPLRVGNERLGLLQFNDRRNGFFSAEAVQYWEGLADYLAVGLARLRSDEALRARESHYRTLLESANDLVSIWDLDGRLLEVNQAGSELLGYNRDELLGLNAADLRTPVAARRFLQDLKAVEVNGRAVFQTTLRDKTGKPIPVEVNCRLVDFDGRAAVLSITRDLRERVSAEEALRESEERYRVLFDNMSEGFAYCRIIYDKEGRPEDWVHLTVNKAFCELVGLADVAGKKATELFPAVREMAPDLFEVYGRVAATGRPERFETYFAPLSLRLQIAASSPSKGHLVAVFNDVTEQRALEEQLRQSQKMEAIGRLAGGVAHDFNNLLTAILGYSDLILATEEGISGSLEAEVLEIKAAAERAAALTGQILAFSRRQVLQPQAVCLNDVLLGMESLLRRTLGEDIDLAFYLAPDLATCEVDPGQMEQVLMNLAVNARDAMPAGGSLTVETTNVNLTRKYADTHPDSRPGPHVLLAVSDTGCGMDQDTMSHVFEPFFTTKDPGRGTGLGLSTVFGIVKQSGGGISVYSEPSLGTSFKVYLPQVATPSPRSAPKTVPSDFRAHKSATILMVEDDPALRALVGRILKGAGYKVLEADSATRAREVLEAAQVTPDLLLTDVVLRGSEGGRTLAEELRERFTSMSVIFMSGYSKDSMVHSGRLNQDMELLEKPFTAGAMLQRVREVLPKAGD